MPYGSFLIGAVGNTPIAGATGPPMPAASVSVDGGLLDVCQNRPQKVSLRQRSDLKKAFVAGAPINVAQSKRRCPLEPLRGSRIVRRRVVETIGSNASDLGHGSSLVVPSAIVSYGSGDICTAGNIGSFHAR